jgi:gluconokinase
LTPKLSPRTREILDKLFDAPEQAEAARRLVEECGHNLPFCGDYDEFKMERIRFAVLRISIGFMDELDKAIDYARRDWRDVLMWAGFGYTLDAHEKWAETFLAGEQPAQIIVVMGVAASGKTLIGSMLAIRLNWMFYDADNFHSAENIRKMSEGIPLTDQDRAEWLAKLRRNIDRYVVKKQNMVLACSALKESYRQVLRGHDDVHFVYLRGTPDQIDERIRQRKGHYMKRDMLKSQFEALEEPEDAVTVDVGLAPREIVAAVIQELEL